MPKLGSAEASVILCNQCGKRISIKGIKIQEKCRGEHCVTFFACPHCGRLYQVNTTDEQQRKLISERNQAMMRVVSAARFKSLQKTAMDNRKRAESLEKKIKNRAVRLREVGEEMLHHGDKEDTDGAKNGDCGSAGVQGN